MNEKEKKKERKKKDQRQNETQTKIARVKTHLSQIKERKWNDSIHVHNARWRKCKIKRKNQHVVYKCKQNDIVTDQTDGQRDR